ncbi:MAG: EF-hand domain-containing protein [Verrucomicrobiales bacterium]
MKKILIATVVAAGLSVGLSHADDAKKGKGKADPAKRAEMMLKKLDTDESGTLSKEEFAAGPMAKQLTEKRGADAVDKVFAMRDANKDGELDKEELSKPVKRKGKGVKKGDKTAE